MFLVFVNVDGPCDNYSDTLSNGLCWYVYLVGVIVGQRTSRRRDHAN